MTVEDVFRIADTTVFAKTGRHLSDAEKTVLQGAYLDRTYEEIAEAANYSVSYLKRNVGPKLWKLLCEALGEPVSKTNFRAALERHSREKNLEIVAGIPATSPSLPLSGSAGDSSLPSYQDWGEAVDVSVFYGRTEELTRLERWIVQERCRMILLLGMGGIGKTSLSVKLAQQIQQTFEFIIWRSLRNAPPLFELLGELIQFLSNHLETDLPETTSSRISRLIARLRDKRAFVVLDNVETILSSGQRAGQYREGYEEYGELIRQVGEVPHNSCLVLTSREKPREIAALEGETLPVRSLPLAGLKQEAIAIFEAKGLSASQQELQRLNETYQGNPLALKIVATSIKDLFNGNITSFLAENTAVFNGIRNLLDQQLDRLSDLEKHLMYWLTIHRDWVTIAELKADIVLHLSKPQLLETLESLVWRSLIEQSTAGFTQQPVVMEYVTERLIEQIYEEIVTENVDLMLNLCLIKATAKDYIRTSQTRVILEPLAERLLTLFRTKLNVEQKLKNLIQKLKADFLDRASYGGGNIINLLRQLKINLANYDFSHLPIWQAYLQDIELHSVNFAYADLTNSVFADTLNGIEPLALTPDGKLLAIGTVAGDISLWNVETGQQLLTWQGHNSWIFSVAFSPDSQTLASSSYDQTVRLWDVKTGKCLKIFQGHTSNVVAIAFSHDGKLLASASHDHTVKLWDITTGNCLKTLQGHTHQVCCVAFSPEINILASSSCDHTVKLWDITTGHCLKTLQGHTHIVFLVTFSFQGDTLISASSDGTVRQWDVNTGQCLKIWQIDIKEFVSVAFSPDSQTLVTGNADHTLRLWDITTQDCIRTFSGHTNPVPFVAFSRDGATLVSCVSNDHIVKLWDVKTGQCLKTLQGYNQAVTSVAFSPNGEIQGNRPLLASSHGDHTVKLWDLRKGQCIKTLQGHTSQVFSVAFNSSVGMDDDIPLLASGGDDTTIHCWDVNTGKQLKTLPGHIGRVFSVAFSPNVESYGNTSLLASGGTDGMVKVWDVTQGKCLNTWLAHTASVSCVTFSPQGNTLASCSFDGSIKLWDISTESELRILQRDYKTIWAIAFSPDGQTIASVGEESVVRLWDVTTGQCTSTLQGHTNSIFSVAFSPDGTILATGSSDYTVRLWHIITDTAVPYLYRTLQGHSNLVTCVAFSLINLEVEQENRLILASGSHDGTIRLWDVDTGTCLNTLKADKLYEGMNITGVTGLTEATIATLKAFGAKNLSLN